MTTLQYALWQMIASIEVGARMTKTGDMTCREHYGELRFPNALLPGKVIPIPDEVGGERKIWSEIGALARRRALSHASDVPPILGLEIHHPKVAKRQPS